MLVPGPGVVFSNTQNSSPGFTSGWFAAARWDMIVTKSFANEIEVAVVSRLWARIGATDAERTEIAARTRNIGVFMTGEWVRVRLGTLRNERVMMNLLQERNSSQDVYIL